MTRAGRRRRAVALGLVLVGLGGNLGLREAVEAAQDRRDVAVAGLAVADERRAAFAGAATATGQAVEATARQALATERSTQPVGDAWLRVDTEVGQRRDQLTEAGVLVASTSTWLEATRARLLNAAGQVGDLRACVGGVGTAAEAARRHDTAAVVAAIQAVADACRRAQVASGRIDSGIRFPFDFPDPFVVSTPEGHHAWATNSAGGAVQHLRSPDLVTWTLAGTALSSVPSWAVPGATWSPSVLLRWGYWTLYYAVRDRASGRQCISVATAPTVAGPFTDSSTGPLVCELGQGGSIDPSPFVAADGSAYLLWKSEGETAGGRATLRSQRLAPDGLTLIGAPATLATVDQPWEGRTVEGPSMVGTPDGLVLLYSANRWDSGRYGVGAAFCDGPMGPCRKVPGPVLAAAGPMEGPGGAEAFRDAAGGLRVAFHAWQAGAVGYPEHRYLHTGTLSVSGGVVTITPD